MNKWVVYTAAFGDNVVLAPQKKFAGIDFICFTDRERKVKGWNQIIVKEIITKDHFRNNRYYKLLPHIVIPQYERSIYIDSNFIVMRLPEDFFSSKMKGVNMLVFDHSQNIKDPRNCIYDEYEALIRLEKPKDDPLIMKQQIEFFKSQKYPKRNGLIFGGVLIRNHNMPDVIEAMNDWWNIISSMSRRDQLSFNYVAWKKKFKYGFLQGDSRRGNPYFYHVGKADKNLTFKMLKYRLRKFLKIIPLA